jgi:peptide deformylase
MAIKKIIKYPKESLRKYCQTVFFPQDLTEHVKDLQETLESIPHGVALASNQIEQNGFRIFVVKKNMKMPEIVVNPKYTPVDLEPNVGDFRAHKAFVEGCLSVPELTHTFERHFAVLMTWEDLQGEKFQEIFTGLQARIVQHECDHLDGRMIVDSAPHDLWFKIRPEILRNRKKGL